MTGRVGTSREQVDGRRRPRKKVAGRVKGHKRQRVLLVAVSVPILIGGVLAILHSSLLTARNFTVSGAHHTPVALVLSVSGLDRHPPMVDVDPGAQAASIEGLPWVAKAYITKSWPFWVHIRIVERVPVAIVDDGRKGVAIVDGVGRVLQVVTKNSPETRGLVEIVGKSAVPQPGDYLASSAGQDLKVARLVPPSLVNDIFSITINTKYGVEIQLRRGPQVIFGSASNLRAKLIALATIIARVHLGGVRVIDLRSPTLPVLTP